MDMSADLKSYLTPTNPPLDLAEVLAFGLLGEQVYDFHVCGIGNTTTGWADLWGPGSMRSLPSSPAVVRVFSNSTADAASSNGARAVEIVGWDDSWKLGTEVIDLNGTATVASISKYYRIISARVTSAGSLGANAGTLTFQISSQTMAAVATGDNRSFHSHFTVPPGYIGYVYGWRFSAAMGGGQIDHGAVRLYVGPSGSVHYPHEHHALTNGSGLTSSEPLLVVDEQTELVVRARSTGSGSERYVASSYHVALFPTS